ncbi:MarR family transcriptional regulator [Paenibacillus hunanensis]|uniref:GbsR/MarR family transcriptional regulator n=1 Tax=Paenibacillus hunanensis TaxID=539262 RepID=UPI002A6A7C41|nr:MarR family transcriptional regulator [Paenibacillus hunanensis]WPP43219.1 MarR family transcriptional regulator [Paenibacillus hunanensis]
MVEKEKNVPNLGLDQQQLRAEVIDAIARTMDLYGVNHSFGELYGVMYFEDRPMTLEEMKDSMNMSKSNMSYAVRSLVQSRMITKLDDKRDRRDQYQAETDYFKTFQNFFGSRLQREIDVMTSSLEQVIPQLSEMILAQDTTAETRESCLRDLHKLQHAQQYYVWLQHFVDQLQAGAYFQMEREADDHV